MAEKPHSAWAALPTGIVVYLVSIGFFTGGVAMMVKSQGESISKLERMFERCCIDNGGGTRASFKPRVDAGA